MRRSTYVYENVYRFPKRDVEFWSGQFPHPENQVGLNLAKMAQR